MKKLLSFILVLALLMGTMICGMSVSAAESPKTLTLTAWYGQTLELTIPDGANLYFIYDDSKDTVSSCKIADGPDVDGEDWNWYISIGFDWIENYEKRKANWIRKGTTLDCPFAGYDGYAKSGSGVLKLDDEEDPCVISYYFKSRENDYDLIDSLYEDANLCKILETAVFTEEEHTFGTPAELIIPVDELNFTAEVGDFNINFDLIKLDHPEYIMETSSSYADVSIINNKAYIAHDDNIYVYEINGNEGTYVKDYPLDNATAITVTDKDVMYVNGGALPAKIMAEDGTLGDKLEQKGELLLPMNNGYGLSFFYSSPAYYYNTDGDLPVFEKEIEFPEFKNIHCVQAMDDKILVGGFIQEEDGSKFTSVIAYDFEGNQLYRVNDIKHNNNLMNVIETSNGIMGFTPNTIGVAATDGTILGDIDTSKVAGIKLWPLSVTPQEDGSFILAGYLYDVTGEIVLLRVTGF